MFRSLAFIGVLMYVIVVLVRHIPGGFVPEEDQGYIMVNAQLPDAASLERTDAVMKKAEAILAKNEAIEGFNTISGYSLLTVRLLVEHGLLLRAAQAVGGAQDRGGARERRRGRAEPGVRAADSGGGRRRLRTAGDSGPRHRRRLHDAAAGSQRRLAGLPGRADAALHGGGAEAARDRRASTRSIARRCRRSTPTSIAARC